MPPKSKSQNKHGDVAGPSQSQSSSSQAKKMSSTVDRGELERLSNNLVKYLLILDQKKVPMKKQDNGKYITKNVLKEKELTKLFPEVLKKATDKLAQVFGIRLEELPDKKGYILINILEADTDNPHLIWPKEDNGRMGLVTVILSLIFMSGNVLPERQLWHALKRLGIDPEAPHEVFGDVKKLITTEFVRQGYIEMERLPTSDQAIYEFRWGYRAKLETTKRTVLNFVCQIYASDVTPQQWTSQWQDVLTSEGIAGEEVAASSSSSQR